MLEKELVDAINAQIGRELEAHLEYLQISAYFDDEALPQLSRFFRAQAQEEHDHAMRFIDYMLEAGRGCRSPPSTRPATISRAPRRPSRPASTGSAPSPATSTT